MAKDIERLKLELEKCKSHLAKLLEVEAFYRKEMERKAEELARSRELLAEILNAVNIGILVVDRDMNVIHINKELKRIFSIEGYDFQGKCWEIFMRTDAPCSSGKCVRVVEKGVDEEEELVLFVEGRKRIFWVKTSPLKIRGEMIGAVRTFIDITEKKSEEALNVLSGISMFISHTVKNSIVPVSAFLKRIYGSCPEESKIIGIIIESAENLLSTVRGYEDFVKIKTMRDVVFSEIKAKRFLEKFVDYISTEEFLRKYNMLPYRDKYSVNYNLGKINENTSIFGSLAILNIAFCNLFSTLVEFGFSVTKQEVVIKLDCNEDGKFLEISILSNFKIPSKVLPLIYEPWIVEEGRNFDKWGFAIAREAVIIHNGDFEVLSIKDGTLSVIRLPTLKS
ncbi:MAG: PAS domain-containing protein [Thermosulfidibacteraceae bacterium]|jgi:PAS domain S-box-containing protein